MSHRKTHEQFMKELELVNQKVDVLGRYTRNIDKILVRCKKCGREWYSSPHGLLKGDGCRQCAGSLRKTQEEFESELRTVNSNIEVLGEYKNNHTCVAVKCCVCGYEWNGIPYNLLKGSGCPRCAGNVKKTTAEFVCELSDISPDIEILTEYKRANEHVQARCVRCGFVWQVTPNHLLSGRHGCPNCNHSSTSFMEKFIFFALEKVVGKGNVLDRDKSIIGMELDIYVPSCKLAIEPGGWYWHKQKLERDKEKLERCQKMGIDLVIIYDGFKGNRHDFDEHYILIEQDLGGDVDCVLLKELVFRILDKKGMHFMFSGDDWKDIVENAYRKSRRMSHDEFIDKASIMSPDVLVLGEFQSMRKNISVKCIKCGYEWDASPMSLLYNGIKCRKCLGLDENRRKTHEKFVEEMSVINSDFVIVGKYTGDASKIRVHCNVCGFDWDALPTNLLKQEGCPKCANHIRWTHDMFVKELSVRRPTIEVLGHYVYAHEKIKVRCSICGHEWNVLPTSLLRGLGCPKCANKERGIKKRVPVICIETGVVYPSVSAAKSACGGGAVHISDCCNGKRQIAGGYHWAYYNDYVKKSGESLS